MSFKSIKYPFIPLIIVIVAFVIALLSLFPISIEEMGRGDFWVEEIIPLPYWISVIIIVCSCFFMFQHLRDHKFRYSLLFSSIILIICIRMVFPIIFTTIPAYEPDATRYIDTLNSWVNIKLDFGIPGNYQHDFPLSFIIAFFFIKLGIPLDTFFRFAPLIVYGLIVTLLYLIIAEIHPQDKRVASVSAFLLSLSSLVGWITWHYCPQLIGALFFLIALLVAIKFAKKGAWTLRGILPVLISVCLLVLSHHLSTMLFIFVIAGLTFTAWYFESNYIKGKPLSFLIIGVFTYTFWFFYGNLMYPEFFNFAKYLIAHEVNAVSLVQQAPLIVNLTFAVYPVFILLLSLFGLIRLLGFTRPKDFFNIIKRLNYFKKENSTMFLVYPLSFLSLGISFVLALAIPTMQAPRFLEVFFIGLYPLASLTMLKIGQVNNSKKKFVLVLLLLILIALVSVHRYYNQDQRRVLLTMD
ncbi:MAG: hypothetical protein IAX22_05315 [Candidatus Bathyarchaeota archaeon]|nr:hypothetical protein [Candidatus Bathyarchaeota archaeon]